MIRIPTRDVAGEKLPGGNLPLSALGAFDVDGDELELGPEFAPLGRVSRQNRRFRPLAVLRVKENARTAFEGQCQSDPGSRHRRVDLEFVVAVGAEHMEQEL